MVLLPGSALSRLLLSVLGPHLDHSLPFPSLFLPWITPCLSSLFLPWITPCLPFPELRVFTAELPVQLCPGEKYPLFS